jgi:predicted DNA-binding protein YlxM (UPF0122 family)
MSTKTIVRKAADNITAKHKYDIIDDYIYSSLSNSEIAKKYGTSENNVGLIVARHFKALSNVRETKFLLQSQLGSQRFAMEKSEVLDTDKINQEFLDLLSEPDSISLTDNELIFCELYNDDGDEIRALEESGLGVGLKRTKDIRDREGYQNSLKLRSFYLRRKPNVGAYLLQIKQDKVKAITDGKQFIQTELLSVIERLKSAGSPQALSTYLKAVESLGKTYGAFEDKLTVDGLSGDSALDNIIAKTRAAKAKVLGEGDVIDV